MTRFAIDRKNRDRQGGHGHTPIHRGNWAGADVKGARAFIKRADKRLLRRQHKKAINEGIALMNQEQEDRIAAYWEIEAHLDSDSDYNLDWMNEHDDEIFDEYLDDGPYYGMEDDYFSPFDNDCSYRDRSNASLLDRNTVEDLAHEVQRGMVKLDLEVIENRDAGKSLGQLLRERLSRPF